MARTFNNDKPWYASAGEIRGFIDNAQALQFRTINSSSKTQAYDSNVNLIVSNSGRIQVYGDRTLQVADSKLTELHVGILVNYIVANIGTAAKQFIFDPNDSILLSQLYQTFSQFLDGVQNERGLEQYKLVIDSSNNNAETRNLREVIVDLAIVPTSTAERIFLNLTVNRSGAQLNA
jgi:phage tail sheath protein FI